MPLQEGIIFGANASLQNPVGVGFGPDCKSKAKDQDSWSRAVPKLRQVLKAGDFSFARERMAKYEPTDGILQMFQCSPAGCQLSRDGSVKLVRFYEKGGKSREEAVDTQMATMLMPPDEKTQMKTRYNAGWVGGYIASSAPKIVMGSRAIATIPK